MFSAICVRLERMPVFGDLLSLFAVYSQSVDFSVCGPNSLQIGSKA